jgi:hypothetical protein
MALGPRTRIPTLRSRTSGTLGRLAAWGPPEYSPIARCIPSAGLRFSQRNGPEKRLAGNVCWPTPTGAPTKRWFAPTCFTHKNTGIPGEFRDFHARSSNITCTRIHSRAHARKAYARLTVFLSAGRQTLSLTVRRGQRCTRSKPSTRLCRRRGRFRVAAALRSHTTPGGRGRDRERRRPVGHACKNLRRASV